ncbi:MAG: helix-turn-helix domain-containing protein [Clostridia bacterium]|nr:helix-turn-helix domain-containing protein [Clostridia bacterium]
MKKGEIFKEFYAQTKEEIIREFKSHYNYYKENDDSENQSKEHKTKYLKLCKKFLEKLEELNLPELKLTDDWWCYSYLLKNDSIDLGLTLCTELEVENNKVSSATFSDEYILLSIKSDYMTVGEFAKLYNVTDITVRQWIRRGKIRSAKKQGRDWIIPDIADKPKRGFQDVTYMWNELTSEIEDKYPFLQGYNNMFIFQNEDDKGLYDVILSNYKTSIREKIQISNIKREQLELELISSGLVEIDEPKIFHM